MKDIIEPAFQITWKKKEKKLIISIIKVAKPRSQNFIAVYFVKPIFEKEISSEEFLELITTFEMHLVKSTENVTQFSTLKTAV